MIDLKVRTKLYNLQRKREEKISCDLRLSKLSQVKHTKAKPLKKEIIGFYKN